MKSIMFAFIVTQFLIHQTLSFSIKVIKLSLLLNIRPGEHLCKLVSKVRWKPVGILGRLTACWLLSNLVELILIQYVIRLIGQIE